MPHVIIITGGIATGKSTFFDLLKKRCDGMGAAFFDADRCVHELLTRDDVARTIGEEFGSSVIGSDGVISRPALREAVFARLPAEIRAARKRLEAILHPRVRDEYRSAIEAATSDQPGGLFFADIPLYFESDPGAYSSDNVAVVACSPGVQRARLLERGLLRSIPVPASEKLIAAQLPILHKIDLADHVIWNDGGLMSLEAQADLFIGLFLN